jgi:hypothetical protein
MLFRIARKNQILQNLYINFSTFIHPAITHSAGIIEILKKALWQTAIENVEGGYFEFGVYQGISLLSAVKIYRNILSSGSANFSGTPMKRRFYGFDSFEEGFKHHSAEDMHPLFCEGGYTSSYESCKSRLAKFPEIQLIKGYFEETLNPLTISEQVSEEEKCAIAFIDCDLKLPALLALNYIKPKLQKGSIIILDDFFSYKGNPAAGVSGAWMEFLNQHPAIKARPYFNYGCMGQSYIIFDL